MIFSLSELRFLLFFHTFEIKLFPAFRKQGEFRKHCSGFSWRSMVFLFDLEGQSYYNQTRIFSGEMQRGEGIEMNIVCLDLEGVLVPEIWIAFSEASGIPELRRTTRDEPDYHKLMRFRLEILKEHGLGLREIQATIEKIDPMPGARAFLDALREETQAVILSDTFTQFATPLMRKLGWPALFCNELEVAENGEVTGFRMRCEQSKLSTVKAFQSVGFDTIAVGDSFNDLGMIQASKAGFLFRSTEQIRKDHPELPAFESYDDLLQAIRRVLRGIA